MTSDSKLDTFMNQEYLPNLYRLVGHRQTTVAAGSRLGPALKDPPHLEFLSAL